MPKQFSETVTKAEFARRVGLTRGRISQLISQGLPQLADGRIEVGAALRWMEEHLDPARRLNTCLNTRLNTGCDSDGEGKGEAAAEGGSLSEARRQHEWMKVRRAALRYEQERGALVDRARACDLVFRLARQERDAWLGWPARVAAIIAAELGVEAHAVQTALDKHVRAHLSELSEIKPEFR